MRGEVEKALGEDFDIRAFHNHMLGAGALPLDILKRRMDACLAQQVAASPLLSLPKGSSAPSLASGFKPAR